MEKQDEGYFISFINWFRGAVGLMGYVFIYICTFLDLRVTYDLCVLLFLHFHPYFYCIKPMLHTHREIKVSSYQISNIKNFQSARHKSFLPHYDSISFPVFYNIY